MFGPKEKGFLTNDMSKKNYGIFIPNEKYKIIKEFNDYDGDTVKFGDEWEYITYSFLPYDSGLTLFFSKNGRDEWQIRLRDHKNDQTKIINNLNHCCPV